MKIKKIKLLKALALTGAFGIVATVPVIVSSCSSTSENNNGNGNGGADQTQKVTPVLKDDVSLEGALNKIYDTSTTDRKNTNTLIADDIKANPENYFTNGAELKNVISDATVTVDGKFSNASWASGLSYDATTGNWKDDTTTVTIQDSNKLVYASSSKQINITSLDGLKTELEKTDVLKNALEAAGATTIASGTTLTVENKLGFTNDDLIHINVKATPTSGAETNYDLQIPTSDINLSVTDLSVTVTGNNIEAATKTTTNFTYNIGIDSEVHFNQGANLTAASEDDAKDVNKVLEQLKYGSTTGSTFSLDNNAIIKGLGIYNVNFSNPSIQEKTVSSRATSEKTYTITLDAKPQSSEYVWADGSDVNTAKKISFDVKIDVTTP
ncbi:hypothetical protein D8X55_04530 [Malacoplasma penetrans]|uniref:P35 lipoprotein homolog n=1 Tax=Malacoplasma penetrans (strain HF-2) TaxID=272633 RepID=Q8EV27_MALP2|nr:P35 family lipoprotein [Malacoplasma penetrans]RXY96178.1 hypothetical protein D8X55_04530 [Malacoplasma penetrans]BAC44534.1 P35 lipoprotein homolog [Malacoplasma penetrans HF-2]